MIIIEHAQEFFYEIGRRFIGYTELLNGNGVSLCKIGEKKAVFSHGMVIHDECFHVEYGFLL